MKLKYNLFAKLSLLCALAFVMVQCNEDESSLETGGDIELLDSLPKGTYEYEVTNIQIRAGARTLDVSWNAPEGAEGLSHYVVEWQGVGTDSTLYSSPVNETSYKITHLYNDSYMVKVRAVGKNMLKSAGVTSGTPIAPTPDNQGPTNVLNLQINALATSAGFVWDNPADEDFFKTVIEVYDIAGDSVIMQDTLQSIDKQCAVVGLQENSEYRYTITTFDYIGNPSAVLSDVFKTLREAKLENKLSWALLEYSTQQPGNEAKYALDGDEDTFWHSAWSPVQSSLPHWLIIDLKQVVKPSMVMIYRKKGDNRSSTQIKVEAKLDYTDETEEWADLGTSKIDPLTNEGQPCNLNRVVDARYLKVSVVATNTDKNAMIREIDVYVLAD